MSNREQKARIEAMKREIERRGGTVGSTGTIPDDVLEHFLRDVLDCPDCAAESGDSLTPRRRSSRGH